MFFRLLEELASFVQQRSDFSFLRLLFAKDQALTKIEAYQARIGATIAAFQVYSIFLFALSVLDCSIDVRSS